MFVTMVTEEEFLGETGGSLYDGQQQVLYWADVSAEVAFVVPSPDTYHTAGRRSSTGTAGTLSRNLQQYMTYHLYIVQFVVSECS